MANKLLPSTAFGDRRQMPRNTIIEDTPQVSTRRAPPHHLKSSAAITSPMSDDFPTPRANSVCMSAEAPVESPASSDTDSDLNSLWSKRSSRSDYDEMYDLSGSESEFPIRLSGSVKLRVDTGRSSRFPSIMIPSPSEWPTIEKMKSAATPLSPPMKFNITPAALAQLQQRTLQVPSRSAAPSLDGSNTSEELSSNSSCPSTPEIERLSIDENAWEVPIQLDPSAINMLHQISPEEEYHQVEAVIEVPEEAAAEMREIVESPGLNLRLRTQSLTPVDPSEADDELSALSIPTPGGFFSSLDSMSRHTWAGTEPAPNTSTAAEFYGVPFQSPRMSGPPTSTAASFYGVSWAERPSEPIEHTVTIPSPRSSAPTTARKVMFSPSETIVEVNELDENYDSELAQKAQANIDRTKMWLWVQDDYMKQICSEEDDVLDSFTDIEDAVPRTPQYVSPASEGCSPSKKSVHFQITEKEDRTEKRRISPIHDGTFWEGWREGKRSARARDVFQHRQARAEAEHVRRTSCRKQHLEQLQGKYEITQTEHPSTSRPISSMLPTAPEDDEKTIIAQAECERQALHQFNPSAWHVQARKEINGGKLLTSPIVQSFRNRKDVRILDVAGQTHCGWAWSVAVEHPDAAIFTTVSSDAEAHVAESSLEGPVNHFVVAASRLWELPFEDNTFDVVSARNLYSHLRTVAPKDEVADEWDMTLQECERVLKPGGYLEFDLLDAELVHARPAGQALGVEFSYNLKTRGYDPCAGKSFLPRLKRAGFQEIKRAWMILPVADVVPRFIDNGKTASNDVPERLISASGSIKEFEPPLTGSTKDVRAMTGLIGARNWEQWMLKLNSEMGRSEGRCLEGVAKALEEGGRCNAAWRCLVGWARKSN